MLKLFDDVFVAFARRDDLIDPTGKRMSACCSDLQSRALGGGHKLATRAMHFYAQFAHVFADARAGLDDGLVHFVLNLVDDVRRRGGNKLHDVRPQRASSRVNNLELFFDTDGEAVSHEVALRMDLALLGTSKRLSYPASA